MSYKKLMPKDSFQQPLLPNNKYGRKVDEEYLTSFYKEIYRMEEQRRRKSVLDEHRDKCLRDNPNNANQEHNPAERSMHDLWQKTFFDRYGGVVNEMNGQYTCRKCEHVMMAGIPPCYCPACDYITDYGILVRDKQFRR